MPNRPSEHVIDDEGQNVLIGFLSSTCVVNSIHKDYGKDYLVEISRSEKLTGESFYVQLKSTNSPRFVRQKSEISVPLDREHLIYYYEKCREPVFLVVADIAEKNAYYLFIQDFCMNRLGGSEGIRSKKSRTLHVPVKNSLSDITAFMDDVERALLTMREMYPGSIASAVKKHTEHLTKTDPRFSYEVSSLGEATHITVKAKETVPFTMTISGAADDVMNKIVDIRDKGLPVTFDDNQCKISGSPIFDIEMSNLVKFHYKKQIQLTLIVALQDESRATLVSLPEYRGVAEGGEVEQRFNARIDGLPLEGILVLTTLTDSAGRHPVNFEFSWIHDTWNERPLLRLPYYDQTKAFIDTLKYASYVSLAVSSQGNSIAESVTEVPGSFRELAAVSEYIEVIDMCRSIAKYFNIDPKFNSTIDESEYWVIKELYGLVTNGEYIYHRPVSEMKFVYTLNDASKMPGGKPEDVLIHEQQDIEYRFMGEMITIPKLCQEYSKGTFEDLGPVDDEACTRSGKITNAILKLILG